MSIFRGDASEIYALASDLSEVTHKAIPALRSGMADAGRQVENAWRRDAASLHDAHAKYYPDSIDSELVFSAVGVSVDIGPRMDSKQGFLGPILEFGGSHSPAYMTGSQALDRSAGNVERAVANVLDPLFP